MKTITHSLHFVTELDENHPTAKQFLALDEIEQIDFLESMLKEILAPAIKPALDEINEGNSWALLKVAE
jgi:hypothetical protein